MDIGKVEFGTTITPGTAIPDSWVGAPGKFATVKMEPDVKYKLSAAEYDEVQAMMIQITQLAIKVQDILYRKS